MVDHAAYEASSVWRELLFNAKTPRRQGFYGLNHQDTKITKVSIVLNNEMTKITKITKVFIVLNQSSLRS